MDILGIACYYHDSSACLVRDGKLIAAAQEERFSRKKHDSDFPKNAIEYCLKEGKTTIGKIEVVAFYEKPFLKFERLLYQFVETFPKSYFAFAKSLPPWLTERLLIKAVLGEMGFKGKICFLEHHLSHAASSFLVSPFKSAAIFTADGVGEWATTTLGKGYGNDVKIFKEINFPHSLGLLYSAVTAFLGFRVNSSEYKVMGLAPYGKPKYYDKMKKLVDIRPDGSFALDMDYFCYHYRMSMPSKKFIELFGKQRKSGEPIIQFHKDIAMSLQKVTEEAIFSALNYLHRITGEENLCMAGGVALNSVANGKILKKTPFKRIWIQPAASDAGGSIGAAYYVYNSTLGNRRNFVFDSASLGPGFSDAEIERVLKEKKIAYTKFGSGKELLKAAVGMLLKDGVIGWFQGRMEWGPRALGNRSILASPTKSKMKDILNLKVKHREYFRPFAPVICDSDVDSFFEADKPLPEPAYYMLMVWPIKKSRQKMVPAVTHVDGSGRLQVIRRNQNQLYYDLIKEFGKKTGVPILVNTSYNIRGEPIVCTPFDAYKCMMGTGIDALFAGNFLIKRKDNLRDEWDSEKKAEASGN
ncbi:MAG: carbamoyltransferase [archaeon]